MKKFIAILISISLLSLTITSCGGRHAVPVMVSQYGDARKSCTSLEHELQTIQHEIQRLLPKRDKTAKNIVLGVAGAFFLVPWFFMDFKNAEAQEYEAYRQRYNHLSAIAVDKNCGLKKQRYLSLQEMQREYEKQKKKGNKDWGP